MDAWSLDVLAALVLVGFVAGIVSVVVSLASVVSYPALLALGLPPVTANVTNTVSLVFTGIGAAAGSHGELTGQGRRVLLLGGFAASGGALGALLLLRIPPEGFASSVPVIIAAASLAILLQPRFSLRARTSGRASRWWLAAVLGAAVYVGYFGAAGGVLMIAALGGALRDDLVRLNALKNVLGGFANGVAAIGFALFGPVQWSAVVPLATGFLAGGWLGPSIARRLPAGALRRVIAVSGFAVAAVLAVRTYGR